MYLLFNMLSRLVIAFLPRSKHLLISWLQSPSAVILELPKIKSVTFSIVLLSICHEVMRLDAMIFIFWMLSFKPSFSLSCFTLIDRLFNSSSLSVIKVMSFAYMRLLMFLLQSSFQLVQHPIQNFTAYKVNFSSYKVNKQGDNIQPCRTPFPILNQSFVWSLVLIVASWSAYRFLRRQLTWFSLYLTPWTRTGNGKPVN